MEFSARRTLALKTAPQFAGLLFILFGVNVWTTECSNPPPGGFDIVCLTYTPYGWLATLGMEVIIAWGAGILLLEARPIRWMRRFWDDHARSTPRVALLLTTLTFGLMGIGLRWMMGWPPFYPENFFRDYAPWLIGGAIIGFVLASLLNWDSLRKAAGHASSEASTANASIRKAAS